MIIRFFSFAFLSTVGAWLCLTGLPAHAMEAQDLPGLAGADSTALHAGALPAETTAAAPGPGDSVKILVDSTAFAAHYLAPLERRTLGDLLAWTPGLRTVRFGDFGTGEWLVYDGDLVRAEQLQSDGHAFLFADRTAADITWMPLEGTAAVEVRPVLPELDVQTAIAPSAFPSSQVSFQLNNLLPFLSIDNTWMLGGFRLARRLGPVDFFAGYQQTKNQLYEPVYAHYEGGRNAVGAQWVVGQRYRLTAWLRHATSHTYAAGALIPFTVRNDHRRGSVLSWTAADDTLHMRLSGSVSAQSWPHPAATAYYFLGKSYSLYQYRIGLEKDLRWASHAQQSQGKITCYDGAGFFTRAAEQHDRRLAVSLAHSGDLAPAWRGTGWAQVTAGPAFSPQIDPGLKLSYMAVPWIKPYGACWQASFVPALTERFLADTSIQPSLQGNDALMPEHRINFKAGAVMRPRENMQSEFSLFYRRYNHRLTEELRPDTVRMVNSGRAAAAGVSAMLTYTFTTGWEAAGNYSYVWSRSAATGFAFPYRPEHAGRVRLGYRTSFYRGTLRPALSLEALAQSAAWSYNYSRGVEVAVPAFSVCHLLVAVDILDVKIFFNVENLFDRRYEYQHGWPMPRRYQRMGLEWDFWN